ncbi:MAG: DUF4215 domain-containing protein [Polyangiaceae bacterium]
MRAIQLLVALAAPAVCLSGLACAPADSDSHEGSAPLGEAVSALGQPFTIEDEANGSAAAANPVATDGVIFGNVFPTGDQDYFSFTGTAGDRVYLATSTSVSTLSTDTIIDLIGPDGTTVIESDNDNGTLGASSSTIAGAVLAQSGTHYVLVHEDGDNGNVRPYHLHLKTQSGAPVTETEPNDMVPQLLPASGWVEGEVNPAADVDVYTLNLNAGDTVFASLDLDPERDGTEFNGVLSFGPFAGTFIQANDGGGTGPDSEALFVTVKSAGTYGVAVSSSGGSTSGNYQLSVSVHPQATPPNCTTYTSAAGALAIPTGPGETLSTITVPGNPRIADVDVTLDLSHANPPDLDISLISPQGTQAFFLTDVGNNGFPDWDFTVDDEAAFGIGAYTLLNGMVLQPESTGRLNWFDGQDAGGQWTLRILDDAANNGGTLNGWSITICEAPPPPTCAGGATPVTPIDTDFEANDGGFTTSGTGVQWAWGTPTQAPNFTDCNSGTSCFKTNLTGNYASSTVHDLVSPPIDLTNTQAPITASWAMQYQIENANYDPAWVEIREVGGANAKRIWEWLGPTMTTSAGSPSVTYQTVAEWGLYSADVSAYAGSMVELVFHLNTDTSVTFPGVAIDDVKVSACPGSVCGDGTMEGPEACDDGNLTDGDGCDSNCTVTACGNGIVTMGEACDDANLTDGDGCDSNCTATACGNGVVTAGEDCDDNNLTDGDGCDSNCTVTACGNGIVTMGEVCDDANLTDDDGCDSNCTPTGCGNGIPTSGEDCDDGNMVEGDGCDSNCTDSACGNGVVAPGETCDDGNLTDDDGCDSNCTPTACGNGIVTMGEICDDGNGVLGDGCDDGDMGNCTESACGNGVQAGGEGCDDGNVTDDETAATPTAPSPAVATASSPWVRTATTPTT